MVIVGMMILTFYVVHVVQILLQVLLPRVVPILLESQVCRHHRQNLREVQVPKHHRYHLQMAVAELVVTVLQYLIGKMLHQITFVMSKIAEYVHYIPYRTLLDATTKTCLVIMYDQTKRETNDRMKAIDCDIASSVGQLYRRYM